MEYVLDVAECVAVRREIAHVRYVPPNPRVAFVMGQVLSAAGDEVVDQDDLEAPLHEQVDHVAADEPGAARDDCAPHPQTSPEAWMVRTL